MAPMSAQTGDSGRRRESLQARACDHRAFRFARYGSLFAAGQQFLCGPLLDEQDLAGLSAAML